MERQLLHLGCPHYPSLFIEGVRVRFRQEDGRWLRKYLVLTKHLNARKLYSGVSIFGMDRLNIRTGLHVGRDPRNLCAAFGAPRRTRARSLRAHQQK